MGLAGARPPAGRPAVGGKRTAWRELEKPVRQVQPQGNMRLTRAASAGATWVNFFRRRMRLAGLVPSR